jgi:nitrilase
MPYRDELFPNKDEWINAGDAVVYKPFGGVVAGPMHREKGLLIAEIEVGPRAPHAGSSTRADTMRGPDVFSLNVNRKRQPIVLKKSAGRSR